MEDEDEDEGINFPIQMDGFIEVPGFEVHTMPGFNIFHLQFKLFLNFLQKIKNLSKIDPTCEYDHYGLGHFSCLKGLLEFKREVQHYLFHIYL